MAGHTMLKIIVNFSWGMVVYFKFFMEIHKTSPFTSENILFSPSEILDETSS